MQDMAVFSLLAFVAQAQSTDWRINQRSNIQQVPVLYNKDLDSTTLGKLRHLASPPMGRPPGRLVPCRLPALAQRPLERRKSMRTLCSNQGSERRSATGTIYEDPSSSITVTLFTKDGCTLCDKVKEVLKSVKDEGGHPHSLQAVDITDDNQQAWFSKYKYDIPVLHINGQFWAKHRLSADEAIAGLQAAIDGAFVSPPGEPEGSEW
eukprot:gnl/TRDRNA2_/TRDRNA2_197343_c0_seq1.p1 gnl/TRDRNA2_/TRDRNA2_197343_c0~~gnl/TRDRNA2_/TRDRNA2_197343_c0_seq1.p1  ORF type:complete len:207 (-),score=30.15 gnl/TRDRNA2_/TRDRNA2_197343_c0_seq1:20-640(-)